MPLSSNLWSVLGNGTGLGGGNADTTAEDLQTTLGFAKQFDPNASIGWTPEGNQYVNFNNSLLPQNVLGGRGIEGIARMPGSGERLGNKGLTFNDPTFGQVTAPWNLQENGPSMVDILGPMIVGGLAGLGGGGFNLISSLMQKGPGLLSNFSNLMGGGGNTMSPQQLMLLRLMSMRNGGGGNG